MSKAIKLCLVSLLVGLSSASYAADENKNVRNEVVQNQLQGKDMGRAPKDVPPEVFAKLKQMRVGFVEANLAATQKHLSCVKASTNVQTMKDCDRAFHDEHKQIREDRKDKKDELRQLMGKDTERNERRQEHRGEKNR